MVVVEAGRRGKQLGEVHGFAAAAVEFVDLGAAAESVGEDHRARLSVRSARSTGSPGADPVYRVHDDVEAAPPVPIQGPPGLPLT
jgi:hypothetical protein